MADREDTAGSEAEKYKEARKRNTAAMDKETGVIDEETKLREEQAETIRKSIGAEKKYIVATETVTSLGHQIALVEAQSEGLYSRLNEGEEPSEQEAGENQKDIGKLLNLYKNINAKSGEGARSLRDEELAEIFSEGRDLPPTPKRILDEMVSAKEIDEGDLPAIGNTFFKDERYIKRAEQWFEDRIRALEMRDLTFEEQQEVASSVIIAFTRLKLKPETSLLGERMMDMFEARRSLQRLARIWKISLPDGIHQASSDFTLDTMQKIFTLKNAEGKGIIAEAYKEYETEAVEINNLKDMVKKETNNGKKALLNEQIALQKEKIFAMQRGGGLVTVNGKRITVDSRIKELEEKKLSDGFSNEEKNELESLKELSWSRKVAGRLWTVTLRAAYHDILLNGTGDFFACRLLNFSKRLKEFGLAGKTAGVWAPTEGVYKDQGFDLGYTDFLTRIVKGVVDKKGNPDIRNLTLMGFQFPEFGPGDYDLRTGVVLNEENPSGTSPALMFNKLTGPFTVDLSSDSFWNGVKRAGIDPTVYNTHMFAFTTSDSLRKTLMGPETFFDFPTLDNFKKLKGPGAFENIPVTDKGKVVDYDTVDGKKVVIDSEGVTSRNIAYREMLERVIEYGKTPRGKENLGTGEWFLFPKAEAFGWIMGAHKTGMISDYRAKYLFDKHLKSKWIFWTTDPVEKARWLGRIDAVVGPFRWPRWRNRVVLGALGKMWSEVWKYFLS